MHLYRESFEDRIAYELEDIPEFVVHDLRSGVKCLEDFLRFVGVSKWPVIQLAL